MSVQANGRTQCNARREQDSDSGSDSDSEFGDSSQYQDAPLRLVTRPDDEGQSSDSADSEAEIEGASVATASAVLPVARFSLCTQLATAAASFRPSHPVSALRQGSQVDQDTNNLFGGEHGSVIRKGIANGECRAIARTDDADADGLWTADTVECRHQRAEQ